MQIIESDLISRCLQMYGEWARIETSFILRSAFLSRASLILDIGANLGSLSLSFANLFYGNVHAVEGSRSNFKILSENARLGNFQNLNLYRNIVRGIDNSMDRRGTAEFESILDNVLSSNRGAFALDLLPSEFEDATDFDPDDHNYLPYICKIDVETSSIAALSKIWQSRSLPLATFIEADCNFTSTTKIHEIVFPGAVLVPLSFPAFNPSNCKGSSGNIFGKTLEFMIMICDDSLKEKLENYLGIKLALDNTNFIDSSHLGQLEQGMRPDRICYG